MRVGCNNCGWEGEEEDLKDFTDLEGQHKEILYFKGCPNCKTDSYLVDIVDGEWPLRKE